MSTKKHAGHPHLSGEYRWGDTIQLILLLVFLSIWISDSFIFHFSTFLIDVVPDFIRIPVAAMVLFIAWILARRGMKAVFGTERNSPELISTGVFSVVRHPIYTGVILFYLGAIMITLSLASAAFWLIIVVSYVLIASYEEGILNEAFGADYSRYKKQTGMLFPRLFRK